MFMCCKPCQREMFLLPAGRHLEDHRPGGQRVLQGEEDPPRRPAAELGHEPEPAQNLAHLREGGGGPFRLHQALAVEQDFELGPPLGEPIHDLGRDDLEARFLAEADFFMDQPQRRLGAQLGMAVEKRLGCRLLARRHAATISSTSCVASEAEPELRSRAGIDAEVRPRGPEGRESGRIACQVVEARGHMMGMLGYEGDADDISPRTAASRRASS